MQAQKMENSTTEKCCHHFLLTTEEGITRGVCRKCGEIRVYPSLVINSATGYWQPAVDKKKKRNKV